MILGSKMARFRFKTRVSSLNAFDPPKSSVKGSSMSKEFFLC